MLHDISSKEQQPKGVSFFWEKKVVAELSYSLVKDFGINAIEKYNYEPISWPLAQSPISYVIISVIVI